MDSVDRRSRKQLTRLSLEGLEDRRLLSTALPDIALSAATTADSRGITFTYEVQNAPLAQPVQFGVFRSADPTFGASDVPVGTVSVVPSGQPGATLDQAGNPGGAVGEHTVTFPLPGGLPINPLHPYVLVVADPGHTLQGETVSQDTASFHVYTLGVITHGGKQPRNWAKLGPPWEHRMAVKLVQQGYDAVIPYNWVAASSTPGSAARQAPRLADQVVVAAAQFPLGQPVDVHFIGHSEGAVVNSQAILQLNQTGWPASMKAGYLKVTMLDPHAANNNLFGTQYSTSSGLLGEIAKQEIDKYQSQAKDPLPVVTPNVNDAEVFYQRTPERLTGGSNSGIYNLWGQVPIKGSTRYYNLSAPGISHAGKFGVQDWYNVNVVPTLGQGEQSIQAATLTGGEVATTPVANAAPLMTVSYAGHASPNSSIRVLGARPFQAHLTTIARTTSAADGSWSATTSPLIPGTYWVVADATAPKRVPGRHRSFFKPTTWLGPLNLTPPPTNT